MKRPSRRLPNELRKVEITREYNAHAEGSALIQIGNTKVICNATIESGVPRFLRGQGQGWVTAEYGMLPRSTGERMNREAVRGKQSGRTQEIQRLIGRSLRAAIDLKQLGDYTVYLDCDVVQADGGTRTASITGAFVALVDALRWLQREKNIKCDPLKKMVAAVSVGIFEDAAVLDLDYAEDRDAQTDMNVVMTENSEFIEVQGTAEGSPFSETQLIQMIGLAKQGIADLIKIQRLALSR